MLLREMVQQKKGLLCMNEMGPSFELGGREGTLGTGKE